MLLGKRMRIGWLLFASVAVGLPHAMAGDFAFDVAQLVGRYEGELANRSVDLDLGMTFAQIDGASLQLVGTHVPGILSGLSGEGTFPYPAEVLGLFPEAGPGFTTAFDMILSEHDGAFDLTLPFEDLRHPRESPIFDPLLDGHARLDVSAGGSMFIAIYTILANPQVNIDSATLIISGQPDLDRFMLPGDYDRNGVVDDADYHVWKSGAGAGGDLSADGNHDGVVDTADYTIWRDGANMAPRDDTLAASTPEPSSIALTLLAAIMTALTTAVRRSAFSHRCS